MTTRVPHQATALGRAQRSRAPLRLVGPSGTVAERVALPTRTIARIKGLLGRRILESDEALVLAPCRQVHTLGMRFAIDAVFCDADLWVLHVATLVPWRLSRIVRGARCCIELAAGRAVQEGIAPGVQLDLAA